MRRLALLAVIVAACAWPMRADALPLGFGLGIRLGGAASGASGLLVGVDATVPGFALLKGFKTRLDFDTWGQPTSGWDRSNGGAAAAVCQVVDGIIGYYGFGAGYSRLRMRGDSYEGPELKLITGMNILGLGLEANYHVGKVSAWTGMVRFRF